ncbi:hypothetical protein [Brasilonema sp. UFV-L1]|nr:hypothetical protein [Brasilonema sp. UFV-L1]
MWLTQEDTSVLQAMGRQMLTPAPDATRVYALLPTVLNKEQGTEKKGNEVY